MDPKSADLRDLRPENLFARELTKLHEEIGREAWVSSSRPRNGRTAGSS
jgi:hypothetical protein